MLTESVLARYDVCAGVIAAGRVHSLACVDAADDGAPLIFTWGSGRNGRLGHGDQEDAERPRVVEALRGRQVLQAAAGHDHTLMLLTS